MQNCRMVSATERIADLRQTVVGQFLGQRHCNLPRPCDRTAAPLRQKLGDADLEIVSNRLLDMGFRQVLAPYPAVPMYSVDSPSDVALVEKALETDALFQKYGR